MDTLAQPKPQTSRRRAIIETVVTAMAAAVVVGIVNVLLVSSFYIPSGSMEHTLNIGDRVLAWKAYGLTGGVQRGDIVVFKDPGGWLPDDEDNQQHLIKRVIGLPGDKVACCTAAGKLTLNGHAITETFLGKTTAPSDIPFTIKVPAGKLWVMGDNRGNSNDSRYQTPQFVPIKNVTGIAVARFWPGIQWLDTHKDIYYPKR